VLPYCVQARGAPLIAAFFAHAAQDSRTWSIRGAPTRTSEQGARGLAGAVQRRGRLSSIAGVPILTQGRMNSLACKSRKMAHEGKQRHRSLPKPKAECAESETPSRDIAASRAA
jgi:hypothetical protein